ncbi:glutamate racemase [Methylobacterium nodulans]|nr:glutamate racemase [Methylobacterium nodulans]
MRFDLLAGAGAAPLAPAMRAPAVLVFDSGLGGLTVLAEVRRARPDARVVYAADDAAFPYGDLSEPALVARVVAVMERLIALHAPDLVVVACNTATTLVLPALRARFAIPFVGTVPAIKPAAAATRSGLISVLATPGTVRRDYTRELIDAYAGAYAVTLVGATRLAAFAEAELAGTPVGDDLLREEIAPCFVGAGESRTDVVVLGCTHYPLLLRRFERLVPWPVTWIDPAPAIARRMAQLLGPAPHPAPPEDAAPVAAVFTGGERITPSLRDALAARGMGSIAVEAMPLARQ